MLGARDTAYRVHGGTGERSLGDLTIEPNGQSEPTYCECCGNRSQTIWGYIYDGNLPRAAYFVQWTLESLDHFPNLDFLIGTWGDDSISDRQLISWVFDPTQGNSGGFTVVDSQTRPAASSSLCAEALTRERVLADSGLFTRSKQMLDAVWSNDPRIEELRRRASA